MEFTKYKKRIMIASTLSLCSIVAFNSANNFNSKEKSNLSNKEDLKWNQTSIISDINNMDISFENNNFILMNKTIDWKLRHYTKLWNNGGEKTLEYFNVFDFNKNLNFKVDEDLLEKLINEINADLKDFGKDTNEKTKYLKSDKFFASERTKLDPKFNFISGATHIGSCNWKGYFDWKIYLLSSFKQIELTKDQIGGQYLMDYKFESNLLNSVEDIHIYNQGFNWQYFSGYDYTISLEKNLNNKKESEIFKSDFMLDLYSSKNSMDIIRTFLNINLPYLEQNPNNKSGIWNKEDLIKNNYESIFKFSDELKLLKYINNYNKLNHNKEFLNDLELINLQNKLIENNIIKEKNNNENYNINELSLLYERIIGWFKNNNIIANISIDDLEGKDYVIWNGNSFLNEFDFFKINNNKNTLNIKINHIENKLKNFDSKIISGNSKISDAFGEYKINYRNDFIEKDINISKSFNKFIPIKLDFDVEDIITHEGSNVIFVKNDDNDFATSIKENLNEETEENLFESVELFDYLRHTFHNIDEILNDFDIYDNRNIINHKPSNDNGIFYLVGIIPNWNTIDIVNNYNGNFNLNDKINFIKDINKKSINIKELISNDDEDTNGYFLLKLRTGKTNYMNNYNEYRSIIKNFDKLFKVNYIEKSDSNFFTNIKNKKFKNIETLDDIKIDGITHEKINGEFIEKEIWTQIKINPGNLFNYLDFIFNEKNIEFENEIDKLEIENEISKIKSDIKLNEGFSKSPNILNIVIVSLSIVFTFGLASLIIYRIRKNKYKNIGN